MKLFGLVLCSLALLVAPPPAQAQLFNNQTTEQENAQHYPKSFADIAARLLPTVVNISSTGRGAIHDSPEFISPLGPSTQPTQPSPFDDFFEQYQDRQFGGPAVESASLGSGFIIDGKEGIIVTNYHVIAEASDIRVTLNDDNSYRASTIGFDEKTDIALLKIDTKGKVLPEVSFGNSDILRVGDWVLAIGNPFGLGGTVTAGIVSARSRDINAGPYDDFIQTDASINRGNSGGPMFNLSGELIGINTAIFSPSGGSIGIGFAIPINMSRSVIEQLKETGEVRRGWLGVKIQTVTPEIAEAIALEDGARGALVADIIPGGPAETAGLQAYDVIVSFNNQDVSTMRDLPIIVAESQVEKPLPVTVIRNGQSLDLSITLDSVSSAEEAEAAESLNNTENVQPEISKDESEYFERLSMSLGSITPQLARDFNIIEGMSGLVITHIDDFSDPAEKGLQIGDVITEIDRKSLTTADQIPVAIEQAITKDRHVLLLLIDRAGEELFVAVKIKPQP